MSLGTRIRQYRTARGYTLDELAERMGGVVTKQALSKYERDRAMPRPTVLVALARALDVKAARLLAEPVYSFDVIGFRATTSMGKAAQESIVNRVELELEGRLQLLASLGQEGRYPFSDPFPIDDVSGAEYAAEQLRARWGLGDAPIGNLAEALEGNGVHLIDVDAYKGFDGIAVVARDDDGTAVTCGIASRSETSRARQRMNHAHEVGHLAMAPAPDVDEERAARRFGGAFLFPEAAVREQFGQRRTRIRTEELLVAKERWGISVQAALYRLQDLSILDDASYQWWCMYLNKHKWREAEPGDTALERSTWVEAKAFRAAAEGLIGAEALARYVPAVSSREADFPADIDRRALMRLPLEERRRRMRQHAESIAQEYNRTRDLGWLSADLGEAEGGDD